MNIDILFKEICTLVFEYSDGSIQCSRATLNKDILKKCGLPMDGLYDLDEAVEIPSSVLELIKCIDAGDTRAQHLTTLDKYFERGGKFWWKFHA